MESWMNELGLVVNITELGANEEMPVWLAEGMLVLDGDYRVSGHDDIQSIFRNSL